MNHRFLCLPVFLIVFLITGCDFLEFFEATTQPDLPYWIASINDEGGIVIELDIPEIMELGNDDEILGKAIGSSLQIFLDDSLVPDSDIHMLSGDFAIIPVYDKDGNVLGTYRDNFFIYIYTRSKPDFEFVTIKFQSTSAKPYEYTWKVR